MYDSYHSISFNALLQPPSAEIKKQAMNAAAARALDCFNLRVSQGTDIKPTQLCKDEPYLIKDDVSMPTLPTGVSLPSEVINPVES